MAMALLLQGIPLGVSEESSICPECGGIITQVNYHSQPFVNATQLVMTINEVQCVDCDVHLIVANVNYIEDDENEKMPPPHANDIGRLN